MENRQGGGGLASGETLFAFREHRRHTAFRETPGRIGAPPHRAARAADALKALVEIVGRRFNPAAPVRAPRSNGLNLFSVGLLFSLLVLAGCFDSGTTPADEYLLRVGNSALTLHEFNQVLEMDKAAYPYESLKDPVQLGEIKERLLLRMMEEMVLIERADELGIRVTHEAVEKAVADIKADYPEDTFEETLLERAVSYDAWERRLKNRLLMEKVIAREVGNAVEINARDLSAYYKKHGSGTPILKNGETAAPDDSEERMLKALRRQKTEEAYGEWLKALIQTHPVEVNKALWEKINQSGTESG